MVDYSIKKIRCLSFSLALHHRGIVNRSRGLLVYKPVFSMKSIFYGTPGLRNGDIHGPDNKFLDHIIREQSRQVEPVPGAKNDRPT